MINSKSFPELYTLDQALLVSTSSTLIGNGDSKMLGFVLLPTGTDCYITFDGSAATTSKLKIPNNTSFEMMCNYDTFQLIRYLNGSSGAGVGTKLYVMGQL